MLSLAFDVTDRVQLPEQLAHRASHDPLTGLPNRAMLLDILTREVARAGRLGRPAALLFLDLDGFKAVNDRLGHAAGDELLVAVAARLGQCLRVGDSLARLGGDEFVAVLSAPNEEREVVAVAERLIAALARPVILTAGETVVAASIGVTLSSPDRDDPELLLADADAAMYMAKRAGKERFALARSSRAGMDLPATTAR